MALATYSDLQTAIANWMGGRTDLSTYIPDFITLFEKAAQRRLRVRAMEQTTTLTQASGLFTLPSDYLTWRSVRYLDSGSSVIELEYAQPTYVHYEYPTSPTDTPVYFNIKGNVFSLVPAVADGSQVGLTYYQELAPLSGSVNWLFTDHPDAYLFGSLAEAAGFTQDDNALAKWVARRDAIFEEIETLDKRAYGVGGIKLIGMPTP